MYRNFLGNPNGKLKERPKDNITMVCKEIGCENIN
jgi:hypothetical protein